MEASKKNVIFIDHWAFLEQFEAPMWADLIFEANSGYENITDDDWFNESHPFHQLSARELKSKFAHSGEEAVTSPALPSSVSKSRGKHYINKNWGKGVNLNVLLDKQQGLSKGRCLKQGSSFGHEVKVKSTSNVSRTNGLMSEKSGLTFEHNTRGKAMSKASCNLVGSSSSMDKKNYERSTRSMVTSENMMPKKDYKGHKKVSCDEKSKSSSVRSVSFGRSAVTVEASRVVQDQHKYMEVSSKPCDQKSGSSSVNSINLGKTHVTPKAEMDVGNIKSRGRTSSSGKSSVGSCSNPSYEVKFVSKQQRQKITDKKVVGTMNLADKNRCNVGNKSKTSSINVEGKETGSTKGSNISVAKSLVKSRSVSSSTMLPGKVNKKNSTVGKKEAFDKGKENATRKLTVNKNCNEKGVLARGILKSQKAREHNCQHKDDKAGSAALTILGKVNDQREAKNPGNPARRIYLR